MWAQLVNVAVGIWLMAAPAVLRSARAAEVNDRIVGPVAATFACIAIWPVTRPCRWVNLPLGLWLIASPLALRLGGADAINSVICGVVLVVFACLGGRTGEQLGGGWKSLWTRQEQPHGL
jgi:hypothetical protein